MTRLAAAFVAGCLGVMTAGCGSSAHRTPVFPGAVRAPDVAPGDSRGHAIVATALGLVGAPYRDGGRSPAGFDCSGFVAYVFARHALDLPRTVAEQYSAGRPVALDRLEAGDLLFFTTVAPGPTHVGIATADGWFVHAPSSRGQVRVERLASPYWSGRLIAARRVR
jgi:peptidoglycan DL-endopeptidase CwlO